MLTCLFCFNGLKYTFLSVEWIVVYEVRVDMLFLVDIFGLSCVVLDVMKITQKNGEMLCPVNPNLTR